MTATTTKKVPLILQYSTRVILWGCEVRGETLFAGLAFFNKNIKAPTITLSDRNENKLMKIKVPTGFSNQKHRGRSQNISLEITEWLN